MEICGISVSPVLLCSAFIHTKGVNVHERYSAQAINMYLLIAAGFPSILMLIQMLIKHSNWCILCSTTGQSQSHGLMGSPTPPFLIIQ